MRVGLVLFLAGCGGGDPTPAPRSGVPLDSPVAAVSGDDSARPAPAAVARSARVSEAGEVRREPADTGTWTAGVTRVERTYVGVGTVVATRIARNEGYERLVLELAPGDTLPGYHIEYVDRPVRQCGSGNVVRLAGDAWLSVRLEPARAHTEEGQPTVRQRRLAPRQPVILEAVLTCDFEAQVEWVLGVSSPNRYRVLELSDPARLVVDIRSD